MGTRNVGRVGCFEIELVLTSGMLGASHACVRLAKAAHMAA